MGRQPECIPIHTHDQEPAQDLQESRGTGGGTGRSGCLIAGLDHNPLPLSFPLLPRFSAVIRVWIRLASSAPPNSGTGNGEHALPTLLSTHFPPVPTPGSRGEVWA